MPNLIIEGEFTQTQAAELWNNRQCLMLMVDNALEELRTTQDGMRKLAESQHEGAPSARQALPIIQQQLVRFETAANAMTLFEQATDIRLAD